MVIPKQRLGILLLLTAATFVGSFTVSRKAILAQGRVALVFAETESAYSRDGQLRIRENRIVGVRSDGSTVNTQNLPKPGNRGVAEMRTITDVVNAEKIVVDGLTESISTVPIPGKGVQIYKKAPQCTTTNSADRGSMLGYEVIRVAEERVRPSRTLRIEKWLAPALNCLPLKQSISIRKPDTNFYTANLKEVTQVTLGEPPSNWFERPSNYNERSPLQRREEFSRRYPEVPISASLREADLQDDQVYRSRQADRGK